MGKNFCLYQKIYGCEVFPLLTIYFDLIKIIEHPKRLAMYTHFLAKLLLSCEMLNKVECGVKNVDLRRVL